MRTRVTLIFVLCLVSWVVMGQPGDPGGGGNPTIPISGLEFLLGGGILLGVKKIMDTMRPKRGDK